MNLTTWRQHCWLPACLLLLVAITHTVSGETRVVCYYTNWSVYRPGTAKFSPQNINPYLCTHLIYAFGGFTKENSLKPFDKYQDIEKGGYAKFTGLKTYNKNLKTMLAIGGWNEGSSRFSPMVASSDRRKELVKNTIKFLRQNHFDGLDLDWEYPSFRDGGKTRDRDNYAQLVQELREEFDRESQKTGRPRLLLTMAVPAGIEYINKGYDIPKLNKYLDWMNILSYDYHSAFEPAVNHHSPLYPLEEDNEYNFDADLNIDHTIKHYLKLGADSSKLVLGIPTYGRSYTLFNPDANELGAPADGPGDMGDATRENGYLAFYEICENLKENDWKIVQPNPEAMGPYAYKDNQWVSYDDELIVRKKSVYVAENNLGGIMFWSIDNDDFRGNCYNKPYPLIEAAKEALLTAASSKTEDNLVTKPRKPTTRVRRPTSSSKKETSTASSRFQNSGGRQSFEDDSDSGRKRTRPTSRGKPRNDDAAEERKEERKRTRQRGAGRRRKTTTTQATTVSLTTPSTLPTTPMYKTPEPPTTPDPGGSFKCEEDGFFPHPKDCKKYFWCLGGPGDLGIIAHQFTCPAGLYFNKAADSCDYTQNVICNKKKTQPSSTTPATTSTTTTAAPSTTTRRATARITAATSKTTFLYTSTTSTTPEPEYYDDEYEYEDDDDLEDVPHAPRRGEPDSEEDPRVIKELIDLIKKVGGVEELEKFLKLQEDGTMAVTQGGSTTPASISRSLYEKVLQSRANAAKTNTVASTKSRNSLVYSSINRNRQGSQNEETEEKPETTGESSVKRGNSRFAPQNAGLEKPETSNDSSIKRGRPQYTTITRQRASTERTAEAENESGDEEIVEDNEEDVVSTKKTREFTTRKQNNAEYPEYVTIRRTRPTSVTEADDEEEDSPTRSSIVRNRQRGVPGEVDDDVTDPTPRPEYVTIQRTRPTTDDSTTSKYITIQRKRPSTESSDDAETTTDNDLSKRRSTTTSPEEDSLQKEKRYRSTTLSNIESSTLTTINTDTTLEDNKKTTTDKEATVTENLESTTDNTAEKTSTSQNTEPSQSSSELAQSTTLEASTEIPSTSNQISDHKEETTSEKNSPSPQLFKPRPFATRTRSTTVKPSTETTEATSRKVSTKPTSGRPIVRKFQSVNRFSVRPQTQSQVISNNNSSRLNISTTTEDLNSVGTQETDNKQKEEEFRKRIVNRGRSKFTLPTSTVQSTISRRRRPENPGVTTDYEYSEDEDIHRTYRPAILADLSSLTSADISFRGNSNRKHIRRRPVSTSSTTTTESSTEPSLKTGPRTLTLARKQISASNFNRNSRRTLPTQNQKPTENSTTESNTFESTTKSSLFNKPRPAYQSLVRTTQKAPVEVETTSTTSTASSKSETTVEAKPRIKFSEAPPLLRLSDEATTESNEVTEISSRLTTEAEEVDSTESNSDKEYKILKPETEVIDNEVTELPEVDATISSTTEVQEQSPVTRINRFRSSTIPKEETTTVSPTERNIIRRIRPTTQASTETISETPKFNRTRKVFISNRRIRTTTPVSEIESSNTETIKTTIDFKRSRPTYLNLRQNLNSSRPNITRLRAINSEEDLEANKTSESNRGFVKRIRPIGVTSKIDEEEKIKLSETNISENGYLAQNLPEDDSGKYRRRKIIRRIRPNKDTIFSKTEDEEEEIRKPWIKITDKNVPTEEEIEDEEYTIRSRGKNHFANLTTDRDDLETETEQSSKRKDSLSKSESIDILRSKRIRFNKSESENENNTEKEDDKIIKIRQGKSSIVDDNDETNDSETEDQSDRTSTTDSETEAQNIATSASNLKSESQSILTSTTDSETETQNIGTSTIDSELEQTDNYNSETTKTQDIIRRRPISSLYKPSNDFRNRRLRLNEAKKETTEDEEDATNKRIKLTETTTVDTPSTFRPRNLIRKFRPGLSDTTTTESRVKTNTNIRFVENGRATNRTRKIIRRLRPTSTTTTESEIPQSTFSEPPSVSTTTENNISPTSENILPSFDEDDIVPTTEPNIETTEFYLTTIEDTDETTIFTTEATTTTTSKPRPTVPSLIGRSRPAYRPRGRPEIRSTTPVIITSGTFRRRFNGLNKNESTEKESEETEDGIIDRKLKKLYSKKQKYTPNVRSTTERAKALEEEQEEKAIEEDKNRTVIEQIEDKTIVEGKDIITTTLENTNYKVSTENELEVTEATDIISTDASNDLTAIPEETEMSTIFNNEQPTTINENIKQSDTTTQTQSTTETETKSTTQTQSTTETDTKTTTLSQSTTEIKTTTASNTTDSSTIDSESPTENEDSETTESNTEMFENPTTEYVAETTILEDISEKSISQSTTDSSQETSTSETTTNLESTSSEPSTSENDKQSEAEKSYKPIRYKPSDRPKLRIKLNRTETDDKNDNNDPRNRKFIPSRTIDQRNRSRLAYRKDTSTEKPKETSERSFVPRGRKLDRPGLQQNQNIDGEEEEDDDNDGKDQRFDEQEKQIKDIKYEIEVKSERTHYPTLRPVSESFNFYKNRNEDTDNQEEEEYEGEIPDEEEQPEHIPIENPVVKYLQTIRNNQEVIQTTADQKEEIEDEDPEEETVAEEPAEKPAEEPAEEVAEEPAEEPVEEPEEEEYVDEEDVDEEEEQTVNEKSNDQSTKFNIPIINRPSITSINRPPIQNKPNVPNRNSNRPQYVPNRPVVSNEPRRPAISSGNRPFNPHDAFRSSGNDEQEKEIKDLKYEITGTSTVNKSLDFDRSSDVNKPSDINIPTDININIPKDVVNKPEDVINRPADISNKPKRPFIYSGNRPYNPRETFKSSDIDDQEKEIKDLKYSINRTSNIRKPSDFNRPPNVNKPSDVNKPTDVLNNPEDVVNNPEDIANNPEDVINKPAEANRPPINRPTGGRNYPRRFNKPVNPTSSSTTTESLAGVNKEAVNARNKNLFSKNRKANIPHPVPATTVNDTVSTIETTTSKIELSQVTEETILPEPTTEQLSTLHHVFAEPDIPTSTPISTSSGEATSVESTTKYNFTAAQIEAARSLERLIEVNRISEVSLKEDKVSNSSGVVETRVMLEKVPTFDRIGAINRVTVIKIIDGDNETETISSFPSNHAVTLNEIVTGKRIDTSQKIDIVAKLHAPDINLTKLNILNNTLEIIETQRQDDKSKEVTTEEISETTENTSEAVVAHVVTEISEGEKIPEGVEVHIVDGPKILDQILNDTVVVIPKPEQKFEINSKSNVIDYSHRDLDPIAAALPAAIEEAKQGRKLAIDSKSVVVNNHNVRPFYIEGTALPIEVLFQTDSPDMLLLKEPSVTQLPTLKEVVTARGNYLDDDQDLLESRNINGRVRIRILGQDNEYEQYEKASEPVFAPIRVLNEEEEKKLNVDSFTLKADVVEVTSKPIVETIKIAPIEVSLSQPQTVRVPIVRIESSQSSSAERKSKPSNVNSVPLKRETTSYFNPEIIFGESA